MYLNLATRDVELNRVFASLAPTWTGDAVSLAHLALYQTGQAGPTVNIELLEHATVLAREALSERVTQNEPEPDPAPPGLTWPTSPMQAGRLRKSLARQYRRNDRVATLGQFLSEIQPAYRREHIRKYARHKRNGCNAELSTPKHEYSIWYFDAGREIGLDVPKIVFDALTDIPLRDALGRTVKEVV